MKHLKLKQGVKDLFGVALLYLIIIIGVVLINQRLETIEAQKNTGQVISEPVQK